MSGTIVLTGANRGLGRVIALRLAAEGHDLTLICRDPDGGRAVLEEARALPGARELRLVLADLLHPGQIDEAAEQLARGPRIAALIHNAGLWPTKRILDDRGVERSFAVNHLAPFQLNARLWPRLREDGARVVQVSAGLYVFGRPGPEAAAEGRRFSAWRTYCDTKRCNLLGTLDLARRVEGSGVTVNAVHPGVLSTGLGAGDGGWIATLLAPIKRRWRAAETGVAGPVMLATSPEMAGINGRYYDETRPAPLGAGLDDAGEREALWSLSERLCGLNWRP